MRARGDLDVADPVTVRFKLKKPGSTLLAALSDRADMMVMVAPEAAEQARNKFGLNALVRIFPERVQQDHVTLGPVRQRVNHIWHWALRNGGGGIPSKAS